MSYYANQEKAGKMTPEMRILWNRAIEREKEQELEKAQLKAKKLHEKISMASKTAKSDGSRARDEDIDVDNATNQAEYTEPNKDNNKKAEQ